MPNKLMPSVRFAIFPLENMEKQHSDPITTLCYGSTPTESHEKLRKSYVNLGSMGSSMTHTLLQVRQANPLSTLRTMLLALLSSRVFINTLTSDPSISSPNNHLLAVCKTILKRYKGYSLKKLLKDPSIVSLLAHSSPYLFHDRLEIDCTVKFPVLVSSLIDRGRGTDLNVPEDWQ